MNTKRVVYAILGISIAVWLINIWLYPYGKITPWNLRRELVFLTGILSFAFMGVIMVLAVRPKWLEPYFDGLDKIYHLHKWAGIWAIITAGLHYLIRLSGKILILFYEKGGKHRQPAGDLSWFESLLMDLHTPAKLLGEYVVWFLLISLLLTLWNRIPYRFWRYTHKIMGALFLILVFHTLMLTPATFWMQPVGILFIAISIVGSICAVISLLGLIGTTNSHKGEIIALERKSDDLIEVTCQLRGNWRHEAGQYAFFKHDRFEGAHPFTIASADKGDNCVTFMIKALGDYTAHLQTAIKEGDNIIIEGPYGEFSFKHSQSYHQIWIAGGVGITPFIAWLEALQDENDERYQVDLYYSIKNRDEAELLAQLKSLCDPLPNVTLHPHFSDEMGFLTLDHLPIQQDRDGVTSEIWFCGPNGFSTALKKGLRERAYPVEKFFHQEIFQMR